jgi:Holliday junction resolvase
VFFAWPGLEFSGVGAKTDADLVVSCEHGIYCCEVKATAGGLSELQLDKLLVLSDQLKAKPAIAALEGEFGEQQVERIRERDGAVFKRAELLAA